ncbi:pyrimidine 5'-nucleotidase [Zavarzinia sp. CC-PAN008]|uniref:pyrimidine 5'-nucleotidase n=1 Tax=Zavarzinia sp. CC-PAN008 TaxID=3243332 RepID=UPI003F744EED
MTGPLDIVAHDQGLDALRGADAWIFDLDNTLYPPSCALFDQVDERMGGFISSLLDLDRVAAKKLQKHYWMTYGTTLRGLMTEHGIDPTAFLAHVHDIDLTPVAPDPVLSQALAALPGRKLIYTNGTVPHAERVMERLGIAQHFDGVFDIIASDHRPKPDPEPFARMVRQHGVNPARAVFVEDLMRNLEPAHALGMRTVWVPDTTDGPALAPAPYVHHVVEVLTPWLAGLAQVAPGGR